MDVMFPSAVIDEWTRQIASFLPEGYQKAAYGPDTAPTYAIALGMEIV
jgi:hypothetical protein